MLSSQTKNSLGYKAVKAVAVPRIHCFNIFSQMNENSRSSHSGKAALWIFLAVFAFQFLLVLNLSDSRHFVPDSDDMRFYRDWARKISGELSWKKGEANFPGTAFYAMPGYPYVLNAIYSLTGGYDPGKSPFLVGVIQALFHAGTSTILFLLCQSLFGGSSGTERKRGQILGIVAAFAWAAYTPAQVFSAIHMPSAMVVCAFWGIVYWIVCVMEHSRVSWWRPWLWIGLILGLVAMLVATVLTLLPLILLAIFLTVQRGKGLRQRVLHSAGAALVLMGGLYAGCSPCWIHNYFVARDPVLFSAHDGLNFYIGNHSGANGYTKIPEGLRASQEGLLTDSLVIPERELGRELKRSEVSKYWKSKAQEWISTNRVAWMRLMGVKVDNYWNSFQYDDLSILRLLRIEGLIPPGLRWGFFAPLALAGFISLGAWKRLRWVAGGVLILMLALLPVFITERYRLTAAPGLILLSLGGLAWMWEKVLHRSVIPNVAYIGLAAAAAWWTTQPRPDVGLWSLDFYKAGIRATDTVRLLKLPAQEAAPYLERAQASLETAYKYVPENADVLLGLGNVWMLRNRPEVAELCFRRAIELNPTHDRALANLAQVLSDRKEWREALRFQAAATKLEPENAKRWYALAQIYKELGERDNAAKAIRRAMELLPNHPELEKLAEEIARQ